MAEGYRRLEMIAGAAEEQIYQKRAAARRVAGHAARDVGDALEIMDSTVERRLNQLSRQSVKGEALLRELE